MMESISFVVLVFVLLVFLILSFSGIFEFHESCISEFIKRDDEKFNEGYNWARSCKNDMIGLKLFVKRSRDFGRFDSFDEGIESFIKEIDANIK